MSTNSWSNDTKAQGSLRALVVYESMWGNTRQVAEAVARGLGHVPAVEVRRASHEESAGVDLLVLGGPTHAFSMTRPKTRVEAHQQGAEEGGDDEGLREWLAALPASFDVPTAVFDTRDVKVRHLPGSAAKAADKELRRHHHGHLVDRQSFWVQDGPELLAGELKRAEAWGRQLAGRFERRARQC